MNLKGNPVGDRRLLKLIEQCRPKQVLDYVKQHGVRKVGDGGDKKGKGGKKNKGNHVKKESQSDDVGEGSEDLIENFK